jgi:putative ABC transport system substrate-binding protein
MVALQPDVIFGHTTPVVAALQRERRKVPIVFVSVSDPLGSGLVTSLAHPGGNITSLMLYEEGITGKWLALLEEIAPGLSRAALMANPKRAPYDFRAIGQVCSAITGNRVGTHSSRECRRYRVCNRVLRA